MERGEKPERDSLNRRQFVQQSLLGAAGLGFLLSKPLLARDMGNRRFFRADELTPEDRIRWQSMKAQRFDDEGGQAPGPPRPPRPQPSIDGPNKIKPGRGPEERRLKKKEV